MSDDKDWWLAVLAAIQSAESSPEVTLGKLQQGLGVIHAYTDAALDGIESSGARDA